MSRIIEIEAPIEQLPGNMSAYSVLRIPAGIVATFSKQNRTRLLVTLENGEQVPCGLTAFGDGDYYSMLARRYLRSLRKKPGDMLRYKVQEHPLPLGVEIPEVLEALLEQDEDARTVWEGFADGRKRSVIFSILRIKDVDLQIRRALDFLGEAPK